MDELIRSVLAEHGRLAVDAAGVGREDDLYRLGLTSHACVNVMLALEDALDVEFPDRLLRKQTFSSLDAIGRALAEIAHAGSTGDGDTVVASPGVGSTGVVRNG